LDADLKGGAGKALVAVGTAHLVGGNNSVPGLLAAKGYKVSRYDTGATEMYEPAQAEPVAEPSTVPVEEPPAESEDILEMEDVSEAAENVSVETDSPVVEESADPAPVISRDMIEPVEELSEPAEETAPAVASGGPQPLFTVEEMPAPEAANDFDAEAEEEIDDIGELLEALEDDERP
jgi:hypothetical protein